jgi:hypothetical protein
MRDAASQAYAALQPQFNKGTTPPFSLEEFEATRLEDMSNPQFAVMTTYITHWAAFLTSRGLGCDLLLSQHDYLARSTLVVLWFKCLPLWSPPLDPARGSTILGKFFRHFLSEPVVNGILGDPSVKAARDSLSMTSPVNARAKRTKKFLPACFDFIFTMLNEHCLFLWDESGTLQPPVNTKDVMIVAAILYEFTFGPRISNVGATCPEADKHVLRVIDVEFSIVPGWPDDVSSVLKVHSPDLAHALSPYMDTSAPPRLWFEKVRQVDCLEVSAKNNNKGIPHDAVLGRGNSTLEDMAIDVIVFHALTAGHPPANPSAPANLSPQFFSRYNYSVYPGKRDFYHLKFRRQHCDQFVKGAATVLGLPTAPFSTTSLRAGAASHYWLQEAPGGARDYIRDRMAALEVHCLQLLYAHGFRGH